MELAQILFAVTVVIALLAIAVYNFQAAGKRREAMYALSLDLGLDFAAEDRLLIPMMYAGFDRMGQGHENCARNVLSGKKDGLDVKLFDYSYVTGSGKNRQVHRLSVVILDTDVSFENLLIRPQSVLDNLAGAVGFADIQFESAEFNKQYYVKSEDKKFAYDILYPLSIEYLLAYPGWSIQLLGRSIMVYADAVIPVEKFKEALRFAEGFLKLVPEYVRGNAENQ